jgi:hypothetical protein
MPDAARPRWFVAGDLNGVHERLHLGSEGLGIKALSLRRWKK